MKQFLALCLTLILVALFPLTAAASAANVATELTNVQKYYTEKTQLTRVEETLIFASMGMLTGRTAYIPESDGTVSSLAQRILAQAATGEPSEDRQTLIDSLKALQQEDGSFGTTEDHCLAMLALKSQQTLYNSAKAYTFLLSCQAENGSFEESAKATALASMILSLSENDAERAAMVNALAYLTALDSNKTEDICWQIMGLTDGGLDASTVGNRDLLEKLLNNQSSSNYAFYTDPTGKTYDEGATALAFAALEAMNRDSSMFKRLAQDGALSFYNVADLVPLLIFFGVLLVISLGFWTFILLHKKSTKTLEETKKY